MTIHQRILDKLNAKYPDWLIRIHDVRRKLGTKKTYRFNMIMIPKRMGPGGTIDGWEITL